MGILSFYSYEDSSLATGEAPRAYPEGPLQGLWRGRDGFFAPRAAEAIASGKRVQQVIGALVALALISFVLVMYVPRHGALLVTEAAVFKSISAQIFDGHVGVYFSIILFIASALMLSFRGESRAEQGVTAVAAVGLVLLTVFPVEAAPNMDMGRDVRTMADLWQAEVYGPTSDFLWFPRVSWLHYIGAIMLFGGLAIMTAFAFTRWSAQDMKDETAFMRKIWRNRIYYLLAALMIAVLPLTFRDDFYLGEMLALLLFAAAWALKGRGLVGVVLIWAGRV